MRKPLASKRTGAVAFVGALAMVAGVTAMAVNADASPRNTAPGASTEVVSSDTATLTAGSAKPVKKVRTTPEGLLVTLLSDLPKGRTGHYAGNPASKSGNTVTQLMAQTYLDTGRGPGLLRISIDREAPFRKGRPTKPKTTREDGLTRTSWTQKDGDKATVTRNPGNCIQSLTVALQRPNGTVIQLSVASCLAWDGQQNAPAHRALTQKQALKVINDDRLGLKLPKKLVTEGARRFPNLPAIK